MEVALSSRCDFEQFGNGLISIILLSRCGRFCIAFILLDVEEFALLQQILVIHEGFIGTKFALSHIFFITISLSTSGI